MIHRKVLIVYQSNLLSVGSAKCYWPSIVQSLFFFILPSHPISDVNVVIGYDDYLYATERHIDGIPPYDADSYFSSLNWLLKLLKEGSLSS